MANHVWYQWFADLSPEFLDRYPQAEPNSLIVPYYELVYRIVPHPQSVLILGAGTGNDVAGALRHGAKDVDAVEIDPVILEIGRRDHPEHPYDSPRVTVYVDDARAFLKKTKKKYDLIIFGYLDSAILLSSFSSLRLDNYVYTVESFQNATCGPSGNLRSVCDLLTGVPRLSTYLGAVRALHLHRVLVKGKVAAIRSRNRCACYVDCSRARITQENE